MGAGEEVATERAGAEERVRVGGAEAAGSEEEGGEDWVEEVRAAGGEEEEAGVSAVHLAIQGREERVGRAAQGWWDGGLVGTDLQELGAVGDEGV